MGKLEIAKKLIDECEGADYVKFQIYKTNELIDKNRDPGRYKKFKERELSYSEFIHLKEYAASRKLEFLGTPHTVGAFEFLWKQGVGAYKVGSGDRDEILPLVVDTGKVCFVSTGMRTHTDILKMVREYGGNTIFMHCITQYPVSDGNANLDFIPTLKRWCKRVGSGVGYSDHVPGTIACEIATSMGVDVIEKHIMSEESVGQDTLCALTGREFRGMCKKLRRIEVLRGSSLRRYSAEERENESWALKKDGKRPLF